MKRHYAGIGARATPDPMLQLMTRAAFSLNKRNYILRSGHADGADTAFENGSPDNAQVFLPCEGWRGSKSRFHPAAIDPAIWHRAAAISAQHHPAFDRLKPFVRALHTRNVFQILGPDLAAPSEFVLCWTPDGKDSGGTGQAIRVAAAHQIPVYNFFNHREREHVERHLAL